MSAPTIKPIGLKQHARKQGHYGDIVPKLPVRSMLVAPSGAGNTVLLTNMILGIYKGCFSIIYIGSPSIEVDNTWKPVEDHIRDHIKPNDREKHYFDSYDPSELETVLKTQHKVIDYQISQRHDDLYHNLFAIDDFADDTSFTRKSETLHQLYIRGRHYMVSTITSAQVCKQISPIVRTSMTHLFIYFFNYRLRNYGDLEPIIEEMSAIYDKNTLLQIYHEAIEGPYSFLYVNLMVRGKGNMFMKTSTQYLKPS